MIPLIPGTQSIPGPQATARIQNLENAVSLVTYVFIQDSDPAADPATEVKPGDFWATLT